MKTILLFAALLFPDNFELLKQPKNLYLLLDNSKHSQLLKKELSRDWEKRVNPHILKDIDKSESNTLRTFCAQQNKIRRKISKLWTIKFVNPDDVSSCEPPYPKFRIGKYGKWEDFDPRTFQTTSFSLRTIEYLHDMWYLESEMEIVDLRYGRAWDKYWENYEVLKESWQKEMKREYSTFKMLGYRDKNDKYISLASELQKLINSKLTKPTLKYPKKPIPPYCPYVPPFMQKNSFIEGEV